MTGSPGAAGVLGVVVVNYASAALIDANLGALDLTGRPVRVVIVDNHSSAAEAEAVRALTTRHGWELVALPDNRGFGPACNAGAAAARRLGCSTFLFLNPDAVVTLPVLEELRVHSLREPMALISPRLLDSTGAVVFRGSWWHEADGRIRGAARGVDWQPDAPPVPGARPWLTAACLIVHADLFERVGGFAEAYFLYWEDVDLSHRCLEAGASLVLREDLVAVHDEGGTQDGQRGRGKSPAYYRWNCRNRLLFAVRNLGRAAVLRWLLATPRVSWEILLRGGRRQLVESPRPATAALRGALAGVGLAAVTLLRPAPAARRARRLPVLVVTPGAELYGADRVLLESVIGLLAVGRAVTVVVPGDGPLVRQLTDRGAQVVTCRMPVLRKDALRPAGAWRLGRDAVAGLWPAVRLIRAADRVYVNTLTLPSWIVLARLLRRRVTCHVHEAERSVPLPVRRLLSLPVTFADQVVVNSDVTRRVLEEVVPWVRGRAVVVHNGVPGPAEPSPPRTTLVGPVRLLFIGRLSPRKGPQVAVAAVELLRARGVDACLDLVGSVFPGYEWFEEELRATVERAGLGDRVHLRGFSADVWPQLAAADVVLVPSVLDESFGNTAAEAVLAARPLVVSAQDGLREAVAGFTSVQVVTPDDPAALADAVQGVVAEWDGWAGRAVADSAEARLRFAPERYRRQIAAQLGQAGRRR
ncbi:glycosyltransferase [Modestobacter sp. VKM Ac-2979]|uniref:glycosyltransferase n=1 Tax=unclassified Modestobacter TaxID=2643866 RepID=UPI0022AB5956|nr:MULTISPECIES: glycosyltransferase [unclassified Modestobacter]MCZ2810480.1 glycosyltransferase [Modestobacter sp. VKM Ac-2979]MCZ2841966.1 glycosyltransferase [Modestobacter sp. VKM Ac-2980]